MNTLKLQQIIKIIAVIVVIVAIVLINRFAVESDALVNFMVNLGYGGIFLASVASGFNLLVPIPVIGFFPLFLEAGFSSVIVIALISLGMLIGDMLGYVIGLVGRDMLKGKATQGKILGKLQHLKDTHTIIPLVILFLYASFVPLPNELIVIPMAFLGYKFWLMGGMLFLGNIIFNILVAFGFVSINTLF